MKDLIGIAIIVATLFGGTKLVRVLHEQVRKAALEKVSQGLPSLCITKGSACKK